MTKPRILFRADASHAIGFGHVARLCALIEEVTMRGWEPVAMFGGDLPAIRGWANDRGIAVELREWSTEAVVRAAERARAVVVDGPGLVQELVPALAKHQTVVVDDVGDVSFAVSTVVNHNVTAPSLAFGYSGARRCLLGRRYLMLRRDIVSHQRGSCRPSGRSRLRVVVSYGSSDPTGATARTLRLIPPDRPLDLVVILGPGFRDDDVLRSAVASVSAIGHTVDLQRSPKDPGALFASADAAICSAGGTLGELAFLGCPTLANATVLDQLAAAHHQVQTGLIAGGRNWHDTTDATIRDDIVRFVLDDAQRTILRAAALATADGEGPRRIIDAFDL